MVPIRFGPSWPGLFCIDPIEEPVQVVQGWVTPAAIAGVILSVSWMRIRPGTWSWFRLAHKEIGRANV